MATTAKHARVVVDAVRATLPEDANSRKVSRVAIRVVRNILKKELTPDGLTTAEIFKLAQSQVSLGYKPSKPTLLPNPGSVVRSVSYLKRRVLPALEGSGLIRMKQIQRTNLPSPDQEEQQSELPGQIWAWVRADPKRIAKIRGEQTPPTSTFEIDEAGLQHLSRRRRRSRIEKARQQHQKNLETQLNQELRQ